MTSLTDIIVRLDDVYDDDGRLLTDIPRRPAASDHITISIAGIFYEEIAEDDAELLALWQESTPAARQTAQTYVAGLLGRLAGQAAPWSALDAQRHQCRGRVYEPGYGDRPIYEDEPPSILNGCRITSHNLVEASTDAVVFLEVPYGEQGAWLERVQRWLEQVVRADT